jgi:hypothetical protein
LCAASINGYDKAEGFEILLRFLAFLQKKHCALNRYFIGTNEIKLK